MQMDDRDAEIAVVGMSCRLPGARSVAEYWSNLCAGVESISHFSEEELLAAGISPETLRSPSYVRSYGAIPDAFAFDAAFFGVNPSEAMVMDPQHRVFLECAWSALEDAGYDPARFPGAVGVFGGSGGNAYHSKVLENREVVADVGQEMVSFANGRDFLTTRVSYKLGLRGPSVVVQTACSTSLVAVHLACQSLLNRECDLALSGGVTIFPEQEKGYHHQEGGILSPDGHCRAFDARAAGTVGGSGAGVVVLKRMTDALRDGDTIHAVIRGSAINNDGSDKIGFTAPSVKGQSQAIAEALGVADVDPSTVSYVEAHGTGTALGDPIEIEALTEVFRMSTDRRGFCALGAVKTNIGHVDSAAGVAGLIKTVLALRHRVLPPTLHFEKPNPDTGLEDSPFFVNAVLREWPAGETPRRAGVSSFGMGGTNAHVVLEEAPELPATPDTGAPQLLVLSARSEAALERMRADLADHLAARPELSLADAAHTLQQGRAEHRHRWAAVARGHDEARQALAGSSARRPSVRRAVDRTPPVAFLFPGQGTQYAGMARELYEGEPVFRRELDRCAGVLRGLGLDLLPALFPAPGGEDGAGALLQQTRYTQPALFAVEYALAQLWMSWGVRPEAMLGHSIGEYVAACVAGVFTPEAALRLVEARGRLMHGLPGGSMLAVPLPEPEVRPLLPERVSLAAVNSAAHCVVSGDGAGIDRVEALLSERGVAARRLHTSHAFHSAAMDPILDAFAAEVRRARPAAPTIPFLSNVTGDWITGEQATDPGYWVRHLRDTVRFADGVGRLLDRADLALLEVGPGETLGTFARRHGRSDAARPVVKSLARADQPEPADLTILEAAGALWTAGVGLDWAALRRGEPRRRVQLPSYPFERVVHRVPQPRRPAAPILAPAAAEPRAPAPDHSTAPRHTEPMRQPMGTEAAPTPQGPSAIAAAVADIFARLLGKDAASLDPDRTFLELGADSLLLMQASRNIEAAFGVKVAFRQLLEGLASISELSAHLDRHATRRPEPAAPPAPAAPAAQPAPAAAAAAPQPAPAAHAARVAAGVADIFARLLGKDAASLDPDRTFLELGADSLLLMQASRNLESTFGVKVAFRQLLDGLSTVRTLAAHLEREVPAPAEPPAPPAAAAPAPEARIPAPAAPAPAVPAAPVAVPVVPAAYPAPAAPAPLPAPAAGGSGLQDIVAQQLAMLQAHAAIMQAQLELLRGGGQPAAAPAPPAPASVAPAPTPAAVAPVAPVVPAAPAAPPAPAAPAAELPSHGPHRPVAQTMGLGGGYTERQARHFAGLVERYTARTRGSKAYAAGNRPFLADNRASLNFRMANKELLYPIVGERSEGSRMWDIDGNEYIDFTIGFGVHFFGHRPPFVVEAVEEQLRRGFHLGPQSDLAGPVAKLFRELTGMERVTFCNTGSEAIMTALRIARTVTGRDRIVMFDGSYHGCFDGILARRAGGTDEDPRSRPVAPGTPQGMIDDVVVLQYGSPQAIDYLRKHAGELAAVLVEPVQNRNTEFHPHRFLHEVRAITRASGTALVFDEMITGLRLEPKGAQGFYGVEADLATYGKVIGGGFPLGVVAGRADLMDAVDGGMWSFGDDSYPPANQTFFAGTFCKHPVTMAAAYAVLLHLRERGQALYDELNGRTARLVAELRRVIAEEEVPMYMLHCASLFHFRANKQKNNFIDLLFYHMLERGIYIWEGRACFLSTAHTDEDCDRLVQAFWESIQELRRGGFLPEKPGPGGDGGGASPSGDAPAPAPAAAEPAPFPLTPAQRQIWVHAQLGDDASRAYNEQINLQVAGAFDREALRAAVEDLMAHHEALRIVFDAAGETQRVLPSLPVPLRVATGGEEGLQTDLEEAVMEVVDLEAGPPFRVHAFPLGPDHHLVLLVTHHLVSDGFSGPLLKRDLATAYAARRRGEAPRLPEAMQFSEYAALLDAHAREHAGGEAEWLARFQDAVPLVLPGDRQRPRFPTNRGGTEKLRLGAPLAAALRELGRGQGCTLFTTLLAGVLATLHRSADQDDFVMGIPSAGRPFPGSGSLVGDCADVLPIRSRVAEHEELAAFMKEVRGWLLDAYDNEVFAYTRLQEKQSAPRGPGDPPLISLVFNLEPKPPAPEGQGTPRAAPAAAPRPRPAGEPVRFAKFDLTIDTLELGDELELICLYSRDLFERATIRRLLGQLERVFEQMAARPRTLVSELELMGDEERRLLLEEWNRTEAAFPAERCLHELFGEHAGRDPGAAAVLFGDESLEYGELDARANRLANHLRRLGLGPETRVGICLERGPELVVAILGVLKAGGAYVPLDPAYPAERIAFMLESSAVSVLLTEEKVRGVLSAGAAVPVVSVDGERGRIAAASDRAPESGAEARNLAYVIYTSGSTGIPKGIALAHRGVVNNLLDLNRGFRVGPEDRVLLLSSLSFDMSVYETLGILAAGGAVVIPTATELRDPSRWAALMRRHSVTVWNSAPALLGMLVEHVEAHPEDVPPALRLAFLGGDWVPVSLPDRLRAHVPEMEVVVMGGATEASIHSIIYPVGETGPDWKSIPYGVPMANQRAYVLDEQLRPVPVGVPGELYLGGIGLARGYTGRPDLTAERFLPSVHAWEPGARMYRTGDRARWMADGNIELLGRLDVQVKIRGFRIELGEIEAVLRRHPGVVRCVVAAREDVPGEKRLVAYVVGEVDVEAMRERLRSALPEYMVPAAFMVLDRLPLSPNGKVDRKALPAPEFASPEERYVAPRTPTEDVLAGIWAAVLKLDRVGVEESFFELGGHSLLATRMISQVREVFAVELPVRAVFEGPTVAELAEEVEALRRAEAPVLPPVVAVERTGPLPLSFAQERLWFLDRLQPGSAFYNIPVARRLGGALDAPALERALAEIVRRHESLRTTFHERDGGPVQTVAPFDGFTLPAEDLSALDETEREAEVRRQVAEAGSRPFDLAEGPLFRAKLLRLAEEEHVLLLRMHHIVGDGWSIGVLFGELWTLYWAFREGGESPLPELPVQYADYAVWQRVQLGGEAVERQLAWWRERLAGAPALLELPTDRPRPAVQTFRGAYEKVELSGALLERLDALGRGEGATLYMTLLGAFQVLLGRYAAVDDVVVGSPIAGRPRRELEGLIGFFVNTLVLRTDLSGDPSFREALRRVRAMVLGAYEHQDLPFERLVEELQPERTLSHSPLFQVMFTLDNTERSRSGLSGMRIGGVEQESETAKFDLTLSLAAHADGISGGVSYSTDLFERSTVERMVGHLERVLEQVAARPEAPVSALELLGEAERRQVVEEWNATAAAYPADACVHELVEAQAERTPDAVAVEGEDRSLTYAELNARANRLAHGLRAQGVRADSRVAICVQRSPEMVVGLLAVLKAGGAYVPLDPAYPADRLRSMLQDAAPAALLAQASLAGLFADAGVPVIDPADENADWSRGPGSNPDRREVGLRPDHLAYVIYTSGSTGRPKGVMVPHRSLVNHTVWQAAAFGIGPADSVLQRTSISFDASVWELWTTLAAGARMVLLPVAASRDPRAIGDAIRESGVTMAQFVPTLLQAVLRELPDEAGLPCRLLFCGGEPLPNALVAEARARGAQEVVNLYGPTETTVQVMAHACRDRLDVECAASIGSPVSNARIYLLDDAGEPAPTGVPGELYVGGVGVARGYLDRPALTAERFVPDPFGGEPGARLYRTGDLGRWIPGGTVEFLGRRDLQVKVRGFRIELGEIEARLAEHPGVREAVVLARDAGAGDSRLVAYWVGGEETGIESLRSHLSEQLPEHMVPAAYVRLESMPLMPNGKLDRRALPAPAGDAYAVRVYEAPEGGIEAAVAAVWTEVLGVERVGRWDHFFELGGHSLRAVQVVSRLRRALGVEVALGEVFLRPVLADFARGLDRGARAELPAIEPADRGRPIPLSFAQQRLWFVEQMGGTGAAYHVPTRLRLKGGLDRDALVRALGRIVQRHEALRTTFVKVEGEPAQRIAPAEESSFALAEHDLTGRADAEAELLRLMTDETAEPFDLAAGPPVRGRLVRVAEDDHVLMVTMHHIVSDGWSMGVFMDELSALYAAFGRGEEDPLPPLPVQYADYAAWQRGRVAGDVLREQADYWKRTLAGAPELLELPADRPRPAQQDFAGDAVRVELDEELTAGLKELSRRHGATLFTTVLAGWAVVLGRLAGQEDVVVGTPAANRGRSDIEGLIGFFISTLALRLDLSGSPTVADLLAQAKSRVLEAQQRQDIPFEQVVELVQPARSLAHSPLFQVVLAWQNTPRGSLELTGLTLAPAGAVPHATSQFDLSLTLLEAGGWIVGSLTYATALFERETVERWIGFLRGVLREMVADDRRRVEELAMLDAAERDLVLEAWNRTARPYPRGVTLDELFAAQVAARPDAPALAWGDEELTYAELDARANRLAHRLRGLGVGPESRVGVLLERGVDLVVSILAVIKAGGAYVPLDPGYPAERLRLMLEDSGVRVLLTRSELAGAVDSDGLATVRLDRAADALASLPDEPVIGGADPENLAYIVYTSGSTGRPKGVMVAHRHVVQLVCETDYVRFGPGDRVAQASNASFDALTFEAWGAFLNGATLVGIPRDVLLAPTELRRVLRDERITTLYQTTALLNQLSREQPDIFAPLREVLFGGQAADADSVRRLLKAGKPGRLLHMYGPTETTAWCSYENVERVADGALTVSVGRATGNQRIYLLDPALNPVPVGVPGEAYVGGGGVVRGYLDRPELTAGRFLPDPFAAEPGTRMYRTGDRLRWTAGGKLEFIGRVDEQVKVRGFRIEPGEIEATLCSHEEVREARVIVREDEPGEQRLVAYTVGGAETDALREHLRRTLPEYMVPTAFVALERLPLTPNGKLDVKALPAPEYADVDRYVAPRTPVEEVLAEIWAGVLGVERVGVHDDFFELGGHSLLIVRLLAEIQGAFTLDLSIRTVFAMPTLEAMALEIERLVYEDIVAMSEGQAEQLVELIPAAGE